MNRCVFSSHDISMLTVCPFCVIFMNFHRQWTDHLEQSAACTTSTRPVTERFHTCTEDAPVVIHPAPLRRFTRF